MRWFTFFALMTTAAASSAQTSNFLPSAGDFRMEEVAQSQQQWTGVAVSDDGRLFANFPRWSEDINNSVVEILDDGTFVPYPNKQLNSYDSEKPRECFVCVQAVFTDQRNKLWILDPAAPMMKGVVVDGPKLMKVNLKTNKPEQTYYFDKDVAPENSYLNDVRIHCGMNQAYVTDSGASGLVVLDLESGKTRRVLDEHHSTKWEETAVVIDGEVWKRNGKVPQIHSDGIALSPNGKWLYYQALSGRTIYRVPTSVLGNFNLSDNEIAKRVERVGRAGAHDGIIFDETGNLYLTAIESNAIHRLTRDNKLESVKQHKDIAWPDTFDIASNGDIYFTTSMIHIEKPDRPYRIFKLTPPRQSYGELAVGMPIER